MRNTYTITSGVNAIETATSLPVAIDIARVFCKDEANAGKEIIIFNSAKENVFHAVSVKHSTGKMVMMMKDKFERASKKHAEVAAKREEYDKVLAERKAARTAKKAAAIEQKETRAKAKANNTKIAELYEAIHQVHVQYSKQKHSFMKAFKTVQAKEREEVATLKAQIEALLAENANITMANPMIQIASECNEDYPEQVNPEQSF